MGSVRTINLPDIGDYQDVPIVEITVKAGDTIFIDDPLITLETDKATMEVPSPVRGIVKLVLVQLGTRVSKGSPIIEIEETAAGEARAAPAEPATHAPPRLVSDKSAIAEPAPIAPSALPDMEYSAKTVLSPSSALVHATPSIRAYARELSVNLSKVYASGANGRILREDVQNHIKTALSATNATAAAKAAPEFSGLPAWPKVDFAEFGDIERQPLTRIQEISGASLARNYLTIPHVTNFDNADVTDLEAFRTSLNNEKRDTAAKLTMVAFLIKASALALQVYPRVNSSLEGKELVLKKYVHIGFAVDTPKGLMVPVIRDCNRKGVIEIGQEMAVLAEKARQGALSQSDMQGGCFSVSSLGGIAGTGFTPIINAPEVAILGAARSAMQAVWNDSEFVPRLIMPVSLSWDHRVADGVLAARFLCHIAALLGDFRRAIL